jgi:hypothetical protein
MAVRNSTLKNLISLSAVFLLISCGSSEKIDRKAMEDAGNADASGKNDSSANRQGTGNQVPNGANRNPQLNGSPNNTALKRNMGCDAVLSLGTAAFNLADGMSNTGPKVALVGQLAAECQTKETFTLSITSNQPLRILAPLECQIKDSQSGFIECKGTSKLITKALQISVPLELGGNLGEAQVAASVSFE